jgi:hypothetical protein
MVNHRMIEKILLAGSNNVSRGMQPIPAELRYPTPHEKLNLIIYRV